MAEAFKLHLQINAQGLQLSFEGAEMRIASPGGAIDSSPQRKLWEAVIVRRRAPAGNLSQAVPHPLAEPQKLLRTA